MLGPIASETAPTIATASVETHVVARPRTKTPRHAQTETETIGQRLARIRRERGLTQVELAEKLSLAQPVVSDYERGELRLHGELIVKLTHILGVSAEELLGLEKTKGNGASIKNRRLARRLQEIDRLPRRDQQALLRTIDRFLESFRTQ
jgi:transcriptional regulator with XRE-family HTH domain